MKATHGHLVPSSNIYTVDFPALRTIPFFTGLYLDSPIDGQRGCGRVDVGTGQTSGRTPLQADKDRDIYAPAAGCAHATGA